MNRSVIPDKLLVTGATGFIGGHLCKHFCDQKYEVYALVRSDSDTSKLSNIPVKYVYGDVRNAALLAQAFKPMDAVIHVAGMVTDWGKYDDFYTINVEGTLNVLKACHQNGIENLIITGSISSYGEEHCLERKSEDSPYNSHYPYFLDSVFPCKMNFYRDTKAMATKLAIEYAKKQSMNVTVLEPVWVYGEQEFNTGFYEYMLSVKNGMRLMPGSRKNLFHVIYAGDLVRAYHLALNARLKGVNRFIIGNSEPENMNRIYNLFCEKAGIKTPFNIPKMLIYPLALIMEFVSSKLNRKKPPLLTRGRVNMFYDSIAFNTAKAKKILGFENDLTLEEGIERTVNWYKSNNLI